MVNFGPERGCRIDDLRKGLGFLGDISGRAGPRAQAARTRVELAYQQEPSRVLTRPPGRARVLADLRHKRFPVHYIKIGKKNAAIRAADMLYAARKYALPQLRIVSPLMAVCLGPPAFRSVSRAALDEGGQPELKPMRHVVFCGIRFMPYRIPPCIRAVRPLWRKDGSSWDNGSQRLESGPSALSSASSREPKTSNVVALRKGSGNLEEKPATIRPSSTL